jgi:hypothetical protein
MAAGPTNITCPGCGAGVPVPATGLSMTCPYCANEMPVPDQAERRKAMEREQAHRRELEKREQGERHRRERERERQRDKDRERVANKRERTRRERRNRWARRFATIPGCLMGIFIFGVSLGAPLIGLWQSGMFDSLIGDPGEKRHNAAQASLIAASHTAGSEPQVVRVFEGDADHPTIELREDLCYGLALGSGELITQVTVTGPSGGTVLSKNERAYAHALGLCPEISGLHQVDLTLDQAYGRYTGSWAWRAKPASTSESSETSTPTTSTGRVAPTGKTGRSSGKRSGKRR